MLFVHAALEHNIMVAVSISDTLAAENKAAMHICLVVGGVGCCGLLHFANPADLEPVADRPELCQMDQL